MHQIHIDLDRRVGPPDDVREDVAHAVPGRFVPGHLTAIHQLLHERVIARELVQGVAPKQVGARVADVDDLQVVSQAHGDRDRRPHSAERRILLRARNQLAVDVLDSLFRATLDLGGLRSVELENPVGSREGEFDDSADGDLAGQFASGMTAHAVGDHHGVADFLGSLRNLVGWQIRQQGFEIATEARDEKVILVLRPHFARMRQSADIHVDE